ncbi:MAG: hypothetical protein KDK48_03760 [Chlamydiia bacterium]|nr:hypothetical protein [Chlamydiia bacterium]
MIRTLPTQNPYTKYDYELGAARRAAKVSFLVITAIDCPGMPFIVNFSEQLEYIATHPHKIEPRLSVVKGDGSEEVRLLSAEVTKKFALQHFQKWGSETETVLSSSETGALYWNIRYHFENLNSLLT